MMAIILIEDHNNLRVTLTRLLEEGGFQVIPLACAEEIDEVAGARPADAYIVDLNLPGEDGISLVKRIRESEPHAFIIITTARTEIHHRVIGYKSGSDVYLPKPVDPNELIALLQSRVARLRRQETELHSFVLDSHQQVLIVPNGKALISSTDMHILTAMASAKDHFLEHWQVMAIINSEEDASISSGSVQVRISRLRKKLQELGAEGDPIKTERGVGYKLMIKLTIT